MTAEQKLELIKEYLKERIEEYDEAYETYEFEGEELDECERHDIGVVIEECSDILRFIERL